MPKTERGFQIYTQFTDKEGIEIRVQESSLATGRRVWIFIQKNGQDGMMHRGKFQSYSPHLTPAEAVRVARALLRFAHGYRIPSEKPRKK